MSFESTSTNRGSRPSGGGGPDCCGGDDPDADDTGGAADVGEDGSAGAAVPEAVAGGMACLVWLWRSTVGECAVAFICRRVQQGQN